MDPSAQKPGWRMPSIKPSIGVSLGIAFLVVFLALALGMRLAHRSTEQAALLIGSVESQYEPTLRKARELEEALTDYEREVADHTRPSAGDPTADFARAATRLLSTFDDYSQLSAVPPGRAGSGIRARLEIIRAQGQSIAELCRQRESQTRTALAALNSLADRAALAARGFEAGDQVYMRKSLSELSRSAAALRASVLMLFASPSEATAQAAAASDAALTALFRTHAQEFTRSPGGAWLELMRDDLYTASRGRARFLALDQTIQASFGDFELSAHELDAQIDSDLQKPAWQALTAAAGNARAAAERTEVNLTRVTLGIVGVVLLIALVALLGIASPVRRLLEGTRRLARGSLDARVPRGGVRELDELAVAFNDMAEALHGSQQALREHQAVLEERIAQRTEDLRHLAHHDPLTELPNRRDLTRRLEATIESAHTSSSTCAVLLMDIDNFKTINDTLGHQYGDRVLRAIAARLQKVAGKVGFLARLGGDEFTLVIPTVRQAVAVERFMAHILREFATPLRVDERDLLVSLSAGIALYPEHGDSVESLLRAADSALHDAKEKGRSGFQFYRAELLAGASHRFHTEQALRHALGNGDFRLHYQPEVSLLTRRTTAVEALLRWQRADGQLTSAAEFIDIAEQSGLLLDLSDWLLRTAVEAARELRAGAWPNARVAVNVSPQQFLAGRFVGSVEKALRTARMSADCLEIELTESALQTGRRATESLLELRRLGVAVALDDFGTGYSTLKSIEELPLTRVKLDRSLVRNIEGNANAAAFAQSCVQLCQSRGLAVTVEGIERPGQLDALVSCGDIQVQGFLIARPAPLDEIAGFVADTPARMAAAWPAAAARTRDEKPGENSSVAFLRPRPR
jgi:diguanylate cyclase (GGDEF)-like protein